MPGKLSLLEAIMSFVFQRLPSLPPLVFMVPQKKKENLFIMAKVQIHIYISIPFANGRPLTLIIVFTMLRLNLACVKVGSHWILTAVACVQGEPNLKLS